MTPLAESTGAGARGDGRTSSPLPAHYRAVEVLGRARGRVTYLAVETRHGHEVVVKAILQPAERKLPSPLGRRIARQARTLCLLDHPNVASTRDVETDPTGIFIVRDLAPGTPLSEWGEGRSPVGEVMRLLRDLASGLVAVHALGLVHGDLTADNVIIRDTPEGPEPCIVDLGLAPLRHEQRQHLHALTAGNGTPRYVGADDDPRVDLHALGRLAFTLLTGRATADASDAALPTRQPSTSGLLRVIRPDVPQILAAIVDKLLSPALTECYQSAASLLADLEGLIDQPELALDASFVLGQVDAERVLGLTPPFVGRDRELQGLLSCLEEAQAGQGRIAFVHGESGVGKSRLLRELGRVAEASGAVVLNGYCNETGVNPAFMPWRDAIAGYAPLWATCADDVREAKAERIQQVVGSLSADLHQVLPALAPLVPRSEGTVAFDGTRQWQRHVDLVARIVIELAHVEGCVVIILDDLQWADNESLEVLRYLTGRAARVPLLLIAAYRSDEVDADHPLTRLQRDAGSARSRLVNMPLAALSRDAVREMLVAVVGEPGDALDHATSAVSRRSGGNALLAVHSMHSLLEERILRHRSGHWVVDRDRLEDQSAPATVIDVLLRRIGRLAPRYRRELARAAVVGRRVDIDALAAITEDRHDALQACVTGVRGALLEKIDDETYRFVHDKVREAFLSSLSASEAQETHRLLADHLARRLEAGEAVILEHALHRLEAGDERGAFFAAREAGLWAWQHHENDAGIRLLAAALERRAAWAPSSDERELLEAMGDCLARIGRFAEALEAYRRVLAALEEGIDQARIERKIGGVYFGMGDSTHAVRHLERALKHLGTRLPRTRLGLVLFVARELFRQACHTLLPVRWFKRSGKQTPRLKEAVRIFDELARIYFFLDLLKTIAIHVRQLNVAEWIGPSAEMGMTYSSHGVVCATVGSLNRALDYQQRGLAIREELGDAWGIGQSHCFMGVVRYNRGELDEAIASCAQGRKILRGLGDQWEIETVTYHLHLCHLRAGHLSEAREEADRLLELSREIRDAKFEALGLAGLALLEGLRGELRRGLQLADEAVKASPDALSVVLALGNKGIIYLHHGDTTNARELLTEGWEMANRHRLVQDYTALLATELAEATVLEALGKLGPGQVITGRVRRRCRRAVRVAERLARKFPGHHAGALRARGHYERARGRTKDALRHFIASIDAADAGDARLDLARSEEALGRMLAGLSYTEAGRHIERARALYEEMEAWTLRLRLSDVIEGDAPNAARAPGDSDPHAGFVVKVARTLAATLDLDTLLGNLANLALEHVGLDRVAIYLPDEVDPRTLALRMSRGISMPPPEERAATDGAWDNCRTVNLPPRTDRASGLSKPAVLAVPIPHREELVGVLLLHRSHGSAFGPDEQGLMEILAAQAGTAIANATAYLTIARLNRNLERKVEEVAQRTLELEASRAALREQALSLEAEVQRRTESLRLTIAELEKANRLKREFLAAVSHELRTPMNAIICFTELVLEDGEALDEEQLDSLQRVRANADHLMELLEELLDLSRIERGRLELELGEVSLGPFLDSVANSVGPLFYGQEELALRLEWPDRLPAVVTDTRRLRQVLINLLTNAAKFTPRGSVTLRVDVLSEWVIFEVADTGIGIHPDDHEAVFEKFCQVDGSLARRSSGLGLGLSLSRELARMLGGDIELESTPGQGSVFRVRHPRGRVANDAVLPPQRDVHRGDVHA